MLNRAKISTYKIKKIIKHFCTDITASNTALLTGINRNTINRYFLLFRLSIFRKRIKELKMITGEAEIDESYFGAKRIRGINCRLKRGRGTFKQPVFGVFERSEQVYTEIVPDCRKKTLQAVILGKINPDTVIHSDD